MPGASPSRQLRSLRKHIETLVWKSGTPFIRNTAWRATRVTARQTISKPFASTVPRLFTAIPSRPCENLPAGPPAPLKRNFPSRFNCWSRLPVCSEQGRRSSFNAGIRRPVVVPPRAARKLRRDANRYTECFCPFRDKGYCGMVSFPFHGQPAAGPESGECQGKRVPLLIRLAFAHEYSGGKGDNCLLTRGAAYVDLPFYPLIA